MDEIGTIRQEDHETGYSLWMRGGLAHRWWCIYSTRCTDQPRQDGVEHHALADARWDLKMARYLGIVV